MLKTLNKQPLRVLLAALTLALAGGAMHAAQAAPHGGPGMGGPGMGHDGMMAGRGLDRMLDLVAAAPEQRAQIKQITDAARTDTRALRQSAQPLHEQMRQLFLQPNVDANAVEVLRKQMQAVHDQASQRRMQSMVEVSRVLSPEQRQKIAARMAERRSMMERHQRERGALVIKGS